MSDGAPTDDERRAARSAWPIRRYELGREPSDDLSNETTPAQRLAMMWELAVEGWRLAGRTLPTYDRQSMPARFFPPGTAPVADDD